MHTPNTFRLRTAGKLLSVAVFSALASLAHAEDLLDIFNLAADNDPQIRQARANYNAQHTVVKQGRSYLLPTITLTGSTSRDTNGIDGESPPNSFFPQPSHSFANGFNTKNWGLSLRQAVLNFEAWYSYKSAKKSDQIAALSLTQSDQDLIMRVATAYFDVLRSQANLASFIAEEEASQQVLEQTQQRFEVGLIPITDVYDSQANADLANVSRLVEENTLNQSLEALEAITGRAFRDLSPLAQEFPITPPESSLEEWVNQSMSNNPSIQSAQLEFEAKKDDAKAAKSTMLPTADLQMNYGWRQSGNQISITTPNLANENTSITLSVSIPLFAGGLNSARLKQAYYTRDASEEALLKSRRDAIQSTRNAYRSVATDVRAVAARAQAIISAQSALEATQVGAEVGTRNVVDVVLAQRTLFQTQRDYANARFNYVIDSLNLKLAAGTLSPQEIIDLNEWLQD